MATLSVQQPTKASPVITFAAVASSDVFTNDGDTIALFDNGSGGNITITVGPGGTPGGLAFADEVTGNVTNGAVGQVGPFDPTLYNDSNGQVVIASSSTSSVTVAIVRVK